MVKFVRTTVYLALVILVFAFGFGSSALCEPARTAVAGHVPAVVARLTPKGRLSATNHLSLNIGLPLRNEAFLDELLRQLYDPTSTNFHKYLTPSEFASRFGPTETDYQAVINFAQGSGLRIAGIH